MPKSRKTLKTSEKCVATGHNKNHNKDNTSIKVCAPVYNINVTNCQIGSNNIQLQVSNHEKSHARDNRRGTKDDKIHQGVLILKSILGQYKKAIAFSDLEEELSDYLRSERLESFIRITGWSLTDFLILKKDLFDYFTRKQKKYVRYRTAVKTDSKSQINANIVESESEDHALNNEPSTESKFDRTDLDDSDTENETWTEVVYDKKKKKRKFISKTTFPNDCNIDGKVLLSKKSKSQNVCKTENFRNWSVDRLQSLIRHGETREIIFIQCLDIYLSNPLKFSLDVVSLWNTPHRMKAYIVIGVSKSGDVLGIRYSYDTDSVSGLFLSSCFSSLPVFDCFKVRSEGKCVGIIEIKSIRGKDSPAIVEKPMTIGDIHVAERELWIRSGMGNIVSSSKQLEEVYHWFLSPKAETGSLYSKTHVPNEPGMYSPENKKHVENLSYQEEEMQPDTGENFDFFWEAVKGFHKGHFVLINGDISCKRQYLSALADVPWICVYDFDIFGNSDGLLNAMQISLSKERHLTLSSWNDPPENISERGTRWCFMRGRKDMSSTRTDQRNGEIEDTHIWFKTVKKGVQSYCDKLANFAEDYTVPTIVVLWPEEEKLISFMMKFLNHLIDTLTSTPNIVLCMNRDPQTKQAKHKFESLCDDHAAQVSVCKISYEEMCIGITNSLSLKVNDKKTYELPMNTGHESHAINEADATWLREDLEVLFLNNPFDTANISEEEIQQEVSSFYKGGTLPWYAWYNTEAEQAIIDRDIQKDLDEIMTKYLEGYKTSVITLFHAPGSGGTTLAQKTLWNFHRKVPCAHLKLRAVSSVDELDRKISFLHEKTDLPVLLLIDGEEESNIRCLSKRLKYTVILYIKRYPYKIPLSTKPCRVYLSGKISAAESKGLESKLGQKCSDARKKKMLNKFSKDILDHQCDHHMYEYGLTVYLHEFKGVVSYVEGYLELGKERHKELSPTQRCLGFLALVYYYGQTCVPCQFFSALFSKPQNFNLTLDDFPAPIQEFVVYDKNEGKRNNIRICHYVVAKEILEQILSRNTGRSTELSDTLSSSACRNLSKFCMDFIEYASNKKTKVCALSTTIKFVLTKTFIFRDEKDMSDNEEQVRKKPVLSKLMIDIPGGKPLFTERLNVLRKLTQSFPDDPNYWAHLGRFHAFCRPDEELEAEKCFQTAVKLCEEQIKGKRDEEIDDRMKLTMTHIYHMYGIVKQRYVSKYTGRSQKEKVVTFNEDFIFHERIEELVPIAETACEYFTKSRDITPDNHDVYTYAYTGEIQVRLQICDFVNRHFKTENATKRISEFLLSQADIRAKHFVHRSISVIENLILECYMDVDLIGSDLKSLRNYVMWYNGLFKNQVLPLGDISQSGGVSSRRLKIAAKKLRYGKSNTILSGVEMIDDEEDLKEIVQMYEENFSDINDYGFQDGDGRKELERDFRDWIYAIRNEKFKRKYSLEDVLSQVQFWYEKTMSPISTFYVFIIKSLLGFGTENIAGKTECLLEAIDCKEQLMKMNHLVIRPKYPREWLGSDGDGIKRLKSGNRHVGICAEERDSEPASYRIDLAICKGTICRPNNNKVNGMIALDLGVNTAEVKIYFIPKVVKLQGSRFAGQRVEFNLAFSIQHGYEAYNVRLLSRHGCSSCSRTIEFTSTEQSLHCKCGGLVYKDEANTVK